MVLSKKRDQSVTPLRKSSRVGVVTACVLDQTIPLCWRIRPHGMWPLDGLNHKQSESITTKDGDINAYSIQAHE